jgi:hypothetical protein
VPIKQIAHSITPPPPPATIWFQKLAIIALLKTMQNDKFWFQRNRNSGTLLHGEEGAQEVAESTHVGLYACFQKQKDWNDLEELYPSYWAQFCYFIILKMLSQNIQIVRTCNRSRMQIKSMLQA